MAPAVEGVQQAHSLFLVVRRARFHHRADEHLEQPAADGVDNDGGEKAEKRRGEQIGQHGQQHKAERGRQMGDPHRDAVADFVDKPGGEQIDEQLHAEIDGDEHGDLRQRDVVAGLEGEKEQRGKVVDDGLHNVADEAGGDGVAVSEFHTFLP